MPKGQVFRQSAKRRKDDTPTEKTDSKKQSLSKKPKLDNTKTKKETTPNKKESSQEGKPKSILKNGPQKKEPVKTAMKQKQDDSNDLALPKDAAAKKGKGKAAEKSKAPSEATLKAVKQPLKESPLPRTFRIITGSYERLLFGFQVKMEAHGELSSQATFTPMFSFAAHTSCITAVAAAGVDSKWLATGAGDETVRVWDLRKRKEVGGLTGHGGTIHSLSFPSRTYLISADSSGLINLYRTRDWALLKTLRGHTGRVNACQAHPSGKVALSVGQDGMLRMWDLMRGKGAGAVRLYLGMSEEDAGSSSHRTKEEPLDVQWSPDGSRFLVMGRTEISIYTTDMKKLACVIVRRDDPKHKFGSVAWLDTKTILAGTESGTVDTYRINKDALVGPIDQLIGHENRVKAIRSVRIQPTTAPQPLTLVVTASSDGKLRVFDCSDLVEKAIDEKPEEPHQKEPIGTHSTGGARLTSLDVVGGSGVRTAATDSKETDVEDEDDDEEEEFSGDGDSDIDSDLDGAESEGELDEAEMQELNDLLDLLDEAKAQGLDVEGLSEFEDEGEDEIDEEEEAEEEDDE
ncbi:WD40 repeat-like protein [Meira miltonrushii]|uniref:WD40 repeat-like protein n=1 Tax=Meira miltonrushii TaxID=1280837 RepID=A0A316VKB7_9BASI|nr:WD40 repeat-like protein [Meira miltonrushii]PWN37996.1 WD40 repeat-like protein [Meira miltonrushii]